MKTFSIAQLDGTRLEVPQLATFTHYIQGIQFRFVVTQETPIAPVCVTHRASGFKVVSVLPSELGAGRSDYVVAGKMALARLIRDHGEARVRSVLASKEGGAK